MNYNLIIIIVNSLRRILKWQSLEKLFFLLDYAFLYHLMTSIERFYDKYRKHGMLLLALFQMLGELFTLRIW